MHSIFKYFIMNNQKFTFYSSYNKLTDLPKDIFVQMPSLNSLYLTGNPLQVIDEATFRPIWYQLKLFFFYSKFILNFSQHVIQFGNVSQKFKFY